MEKTAIEVYPDQDNQVHIHRANMLQGIILDVEEARQVRKSLADLLLGTDVCEYDITFGREDIVLLHDAISLLSVERARALETRLDMLLGLWPERKDDEKEAG